MLQTKIIATLGPATEDKAIIKRMYDKGMRIARLNMSHGDHTWARKTIAMLRECNEELPSPIGIMIDTKGPEIRTEDRVEPLEITEGMSIGLVYELRKANAEVKGTVIGVDYRDIAKDLQKGDIVMVDGGKLRIKITKVEKGLVTGKALDTCVLTGRRHINLPGVPIRLPMLSVQDKKDISFAVREGADFIALSFIRHKRDIRMVRTMLAKHKGSIQLIAKIETQEAVNNLDGICEEADGIMIARGDLGVEAGLEKIPLLQEMIMTTVSNNKKPCIMATEMLESMRTNPTPTRAELSDVGQACFNMVDCLMLSGETSTGKYPVECVTMMHDIAQIIEHYNKRSYQGGEVSDMDPMLQGVVSLGKAVKADALILLTNTLEVAQMVSWTRSHIPIYVITKDKKLPGATTLLYGVEAVQMDTGKNAEEREKIVREFLKKVSPNGKMKNVVIYTDKSIPYNSANSIELLTL